MESFPVRGAYPLEEAAKLIGGVDEKSVKRLVNRGYLKRLPGIRRYLITAESLFRYLELPMPPK
jgi:hypothetical protein